MRLASKHDARERPTLTTYKQVVNYLLRTYETDENITDTGDEITMFMLLADKTSTQHAKKVMAKTLRCGDVYEEQVLNEVFIKRIAQSIKQSMREYWSTKKAVNINALAFHASLLVIF